MAADTNVKREHIEGYAVLDVADYPVAWCLSREDAQAIAAQHAQRKVVRMRVRFMVSKKEEPA